MSKLATIKEEIIVDRISKSTYHKKEFRGQTMIESTTILEPFYVRKIPLWKRILDIIGAIFGLILFSPLFLFISVFIKIVSPGPIIFKQERVGQGGKIFKIWKFRTMKFNSEIYNHKCHICALLENDKPMIKLDNDPRIIPFGWLIRKACLDELPQLINVLLGEMSLVGPRPDVLYAAEKYETWYNARLNSTPGITGLWQVSGKNNTTYREMMRLDITYDKQMSLWTDLKILLLTIPVVIFQITDKSFTEVQLKSNKEKFRYDSDAI